VLRLAAIRHITFGPNPDRPDLYGLTHVFHERCAAYEIDVGIDAPLTGNRNSFSQMSERMLAQLGGEPELVVIGHAVSDSDLSVSVSGYLQQRITPRGLVFAVSGQGRTTGSAALWATWGMAHGRGHRRIAMLALDQTTIPWPDPLLAGMDLETDHAVGLLFTPEGRIRVTTPRPVPGVAPDQVTTTVAAALAELPVSALPTERVLVMGDSIAAETAAELSTVVGCRPRQAAPGRWCTAVWAELAQELTLPTAVDRAVISIEYDPALHYLGMTVFEVPADQRNPGGAK
jgi:hypothetical protein